MSKKGTKNDIDKALQTPAEKETTSLWDIGPACHPFRESLPTDLTLRWIRLRAGRPLGAPQVVGRSRFGAGSLEKVRGFPWFVATKMFSKNCQPYKCPGLDQGQNGEPGLLKAFHKSHPIGFDQATLSSALTYLK